MNCYQNICFYWKISSFLVKKILSRLFMTTSFRFGNHICNKGELLFGAQSAELYFSIRRAEVDLKKKKHFHLEYFWSNLVRK